MPAKQDARWPHKQPPPYWIARTDLYLGEPGAGTLPVRAFAPGDQVPHEHVQRYGWHDHVDLPDGFGTEPPETGATATASPPAKPAREE